MPDLVEQMYCSQQIHIPPSFPFILKQYAKAAIRTQPYDLLKWSAAYFRAMASGEEPPVKIRLEYPPIDTPSGLSPGYLKVLLKQMGKCGTVSKALLREKWEGVCLDEEALKDMLHICDPKHDDILWLDFVAVAAGHLTNSLSQTMILLCELLTDDPEGGPAKIQCELFCSLYKFLAELECGPLEDRQLEADRRLGEEEDTRSYISEICPGDTGEIQPDDSLIAVPPESVLGFALHILPPQDTEGSTDTSLKGHLPVGSAEEVASELLHAQLSHIPESPPEPQTKSEAQTKKDASEVAQPVRRPPRPPMPDIRIQSSDLQPEDCPSQTDTRQKPKDSDHDLQDGPEEHTELQQKSSESSGASDGEALSQHSATQAEVTESHDKPNEGQQPTGVQPVIETDKLKGMSELGKKPDHTSEPQDNAIEQSKDMSHDKMNQETSETRPVLEIDQPQGVSELGKKPDHTSKPQDNAIEQSKDMSHDEVNENQEASEAHPVLEIDLLQGISELGKKPEDTAVQPPVDDFDLRSKASVTGPSLGAVPTNSDMGAIYSATAYDHVPQDFVHPATIHSNIRESSMLPLDTTYESWQSIVRDAPLPEDTFLIESQHSLTTLPGSRERLFDTDRPQGALEYQPVMVRPPLQGSKKEVPGIGPRLESEQIHAVLDYMVYWAARQEGQVMPRNVRHFLCPPLDKVPVPDSEM